MKLKNYSMLACLVTITYVMNAQYIYFNNTYESWQGGSAQANIQLLNNSYITFGTGGYNSFEYRKVDLYGQSLENSNANTASLDPVYAPTGTDLVFKKGDQFITSAMSYSFPGCQYATIPGCMALDSSFNVIWTRQFPEWAICDTVDAENISLCAVDDTSFAMLSSFAYTNGQTSIDSMGWYITRLKYTDGSVLENHRFITPYPAYGLRQIRYSNGYYFVVGQLRAIDSPFPLLSDQQTLLCRIDLDGTSLLELQYGNPNACIEMEPQIRVLPNGDIALSYELCLDQHPEATSPWPYRHSEPRLAFINHETFSPYMDISYELPLMDLWNLGLYTSAMLVDDEGKILVVEHTWNQDSTYFDLTNFIPNLNHIIKFNSDGSIDWQHQFEPNTNNTDPSSNHPYIFDIIQTSDGGYIGTGTAYDEDQQLHWLLKIDNCGYEQPSGCPAVVSTNEHETENNTIQLWPNPCHNVLKGIIPADAVAVRFIDQTGRVVMEEKVYYPNQQWDVSGLECGVYVVEVVSDSGAVETARVVKQ